MPRSHVVISLVYGLLALGLLVMLVGAWALLHPPSLDGTDAVVARLFKLLVLPTLIGVIGTTYARERRRWRRRSDAAFAAVGLAPAHTDHAWHYQGTVDGVQVDAWFWRTRHERLHLEVQRGSDTPRHVRFQPPVPPFGVFGAPGIVHVAQARGPAGEPVPIVADGDPVAHELLAEPAFRAAVGDLLERHPGGSAVVRTTPSGWLFAWSGLPTRTAGEPELTPENVRAWVDGLAAVAAASAHRNV